MEGDAAGSCTPCPPRRREHSPRRSGGPGTDGGCASARPWSLQLEPYRVIDMVKLMERRSVIDMRKRFIYRNGDAQECAERLPPLLDVEDQQLIRGDRLLHRLIVLSKDGLAMRAIGETIVEGAGGDNVPGHC